MKMRVCPDCGYIDRSMWRQNRWRTEVDFIHDEFTEDIPESVLVDLEAGKMYSITDNYAYRLTKKNGERNGIIERILIELWEAHGSQGFHIPREKVEH